MRPQGRGIVISGGIVEVAELRRGTNPQSIARALLCCLSVNSASLGPDRLCCCLLNSLDGVRGCLVSGFSRHERPGGHSPCGTDTAHSRRASQFERRTMWGQPPPAVRRSAALLAVQRSCPPLKKLDGGRASPPAQVRALACFPNSLLATTNHIGVGRLVRPAERSSATHGIVIPNEPHLRTEESADKSPKPLQKHGKSGVTTPTTNLLKMVFWSCAYVPLAGIRM